MLYYIWIFLKFPFSLILKLKFICRAEIIFQIIPNFYPLLADKVRAGIFSSLRQILEKRVLPTLFPLFDNPKLDRELRTMVREAFKEFCLPPTTEGKFVSITHVILLHCIMYVILFLNTDFCLQWRILRCFCFIVLLTPS